MSESAGLRARKKDRTRQVLSDTAIEMFLADGFDRVGVADIAAAAEVSKPTLFRYFASKEDLVLHRFADHQGEAAGVVRARAAGLSPLQALHRHFRAGLDARDPVTGLCDHPQVLAFHRLVFDTPSLAARVTAYAAAETESLAESLAESPGTPSDPLAHSLVAAQFIVVRQALARRNWAELAGGRSAQDVHREAVAAAELAFSLLSDGASSRGY
ncbi:TetR/AcrR family transcriptional regulator [Streptomyces beijiangensis]|uniref:TetR/AcrR family transcriptional regulator n=1 Tax=Streptomyces beijiangensis TaxID=163361 RepID=A0A939FEQ8_9ACTN|nr:TetR family transcriptional regulator [Streptomyces beijiangensis]MBO0516744.1 TetR/AcrR family transcriptional regulator [Streptomyces beijiangensis]